jgi:hypothetical protein
MPCIHSRGAVLAAGVTLGMIRVEGPRPGIVSVTSGQASATRTSIQVMENVANTPESC